MKYTLDIVPYSLNNYRNAHHFKLHKIKKDIGELVHWQLLAQKVKPIKTPVSITFIFNFKTKAKHDLDNYVATAKMVLDALTPIKLPQKTYGVGMIPDDCTEFIKELIFKEGTGKPDTVEIIIVSL